MAKGKHIGLLTLAALGLPLGLSACGKEDKGDRDLSSLDESLTNASDPALRGALEGQIIVDPELAEKSNSYAVRPGDRPVSGGIPASIRATAYDAPVGGKLFRAPEAKAAEPCPQCGGEGAVTLGARARQQAATQGKTGGCVENLQYGMGWASRLPAEFPLYPKAKLMEAAGADGANCNLRVASFVTNQPMRNVIDYYYTRALRGGFDADHRLMNGEHVLGGTRKKDEGAYFITFAEQKGGGTAVDIVANNGR